MLVIRVQTRLLSSGDDRENAKRGVHPRRRIMIDIVEAKSAAEYASARALFKEYARELGIDLCFQDFEFELDHLDEMYASPSGCLLLGRGAGAVAAPDSSGVSTAKAPATVRWIACVGVRRVSAEVCEMKRLYVRQDARGSGLGRRLAVAAIAAARTRGYRTMVLDTLARMVTARSLYSSLGFRESGPYYANPLPDVVYMALSLESSAARPVGRAR
jgi:putative acetyltransferase